MAAFTVHVWTTGVLVPGLGVPGRLVPRGDGEDHRISARGPAREHYPPARDNLGDLA